MIIPAKEIAQSLAESLARTHRPSESFFAAFIVGKDPRMESFVRIKERIAKQIGIDFHVISFPESISTHELYNEVEYYASLRLCTGIIIQLPLPAHIDTEKILRIIPREKDPDVLGEEAQELFEKQKHIITPPPVRTLIHIFSFLFPELTLADALAPMSCAVLGMGKVIGKPVATWLRARAKRVIPLDKGFDKSLLKHADLIISGTGAPHIFDGSVLKEQAIVVDFGYGTIQGKIAGDFNPAYAPETIAYTQTPGGTGPLLVASLFENYETLQREYFRS